MYSFENPIFELILVFDRDREASGPKSLIVVLVVVLVLVLVPILLLMVNHESFSWLFMNMFHALRRFMKKHDP